MQRFTTAFPDPFRRDEMLSSSFTKREMMPRGQKTRTWKCQSREGKRNADYSLSGKFNLTSQRESIRAMSGSCGTRPCELYERNAGLSTSISRRLSDSFSAFIAFESFGCADGIDFFLAKIFEKRNVRNRLPLKPDFLTTKR